MRKGFVERKTSETKLSVELSPDGGDVSLDTGIGFFDHMLHSFAVHSGFGLTVKAEGDLHVDGHHTIEDTGIAMGKALKEAIGDKRGITRFADAFVPMDEALAFCALDISGRPFLHFDAEFSGPAIGDYSTQMTEEFMRALAFNAGITVHLRCEYGSNDHHMTEALYKALARALKIACKIEGGGIPSAKGVL